MSSRMPHSGRRTHDARAAFHPGICVLLPLCGILERILSKLGASCREVGEADGIGRVWRGGRGMLILVIDQSGDR